MVSKPKASVKIVKMTIVRMCDTCLTDHTGEIECDGIQEDVGWFAEFDCD